MSPVRSRARRHLLVPEVVQTSAMDCGPAALKCLLEGFGIHVSYGRLREACQTDVDGTSIDMMEDVAIQLGLEAEQTMVPVDHLLLPEARILPALVVVCLPNGITHFVVAWSRHGSLVQVMDPATGRRWSTCQRFLQEIYIHTFPVAAAYWCEWAKSDEFLGALSRRPAHLGLPRWTKRRIIEAALATPGWQRLASLDAATRMVDTFVRSGGVSRGRQASRILENLCRQGWEEPSDGTQTIPTDYWSVRPAPSGPAKEELLLLRGAVVVRVLGRCQKAGVEETSRPSPLSSEMLAALEEPGSQPGRNILGLMRADGLLAPAALVAAIALAAGGVVAEALLLRGLFDLTRELTVAEQRLGAMGVLLGFLLVFLILDLSIAGSVLRFGRRIEARMRVAFLQKVPRLGDRYFHSRLISDMAERGHSVHLLRLLPELSEQFLRSTFALVLTTVGISWLDPASAPLAALVSAFSVGLPLAAQPLMLERDLRVRSHVGGLNRFYLDALLGLVAIRAHRAEKAIRREHEGLLGKWVRASLELQRTVVGVEGLQSLVGFGLAAWLLLGYLARGGEAGTVLLLIYWALYLPVLGQEIALTARQYPVQRNVTLRLLEPLGTPEGTEVPRDSRPTEKVLKEPLSGVSVALEGVSVLAAGHTILEGIDLTIEAGSHIAIVGPSGAGKSTLVGLLLGLYRPARGRAIIDGEPLDGPALEQLRRQTAWVDPAVQLWNRSFLDNLRYGASSGANLHLGRAIEMASLHGILERLPDGLQTPLGEGGALIAGGEGQRVRLGRAILRSGIRLVVLDEPFRGLDRQQRRELMSRVRRWWREATLLCITHDVHETQAFDRVLIVEGGASSRMVPRMSCKHDLTPATVPCWRRK